VAVRKNETFNLDFEDPGRYYLARSVEGDSYDQWDHDREAYRDRYAKSNNYGGSSYGGYSAYVGYGWSDLNYYGNYIFVPGYGYVWRPFFVNAGWNPYLNGAWAYYPSFGYLWVSAYPWGWLPYRYGSWFYLGGYGWCWQAGHNRWRWNNWHRVTPVYRAPRGFTAPVAPATANRGIVPVGSGLQPTVAEGTGGGRGAGRRRAVIEDIQTPRNPSGNAFRGGITTTNTDSEPMIERSSGRSPLAGDRGQAGGGRNAGSGGDDARVLRGRTLDRDSGTVTKGQSRGQQESRQEARSGYRSVDSERSSAGTSRGNSDRGNGRVADGGWRSFDSGRGSSPQPSRGGGASTQARPAPSYRSGGSSGGYSGGRSSGGSSGGGRSSGAVSGGGGGGGASRGSSSSPR
jgi:hypothetical protein